MIRRAIFFVVLSVCLIATAQAQSSGKPARAAGRVEAVSQDSLTVALPGNTRLVMKVDGSTKLTGRGVEARGGAGARNARKPVTDLVKTDDNVVVTYVGATESDRVATEINVR